MQQIYAPAAAEQSAKTRPANSLLVRLKPPLIHIAQQPYHAADAEDIGPAPGPLARQGAAALHDGVYKPPVEFLAAAAQEQQAENPLILAHKLEIIAQIPQKAALSAALPLRGYRLAAMASSSISPRSASVSV